jgi:tRNA(fMet)-specific endonuclease VapC
MLATGPRYLLDTNILVHYARRDATQQRIEAQYHLMMVPDPPLVCYVCEAEIRSLARQLGWGAQRLNQLEFMLTLIERVPIEGSDILNAYVEIDYFSLNLGREMGKNDLWIAAVAHVTGATLLTTDQDFNHLNGIFLQGVYITP